MSIYIRLCFALSAGVLAFAGCSDTKPEGARLGTAEVIRLAKQAAERQGADLRRYKKPEAQYLSKEKSWFVSFKGRVAGTTGNYCSVLVDDQTGEASFHGGQ